MYDCIKKDKVEGLLQDFFCDKHEKGCPVSKNEYYILKDFVKFVQKDDNVR